MSGDLLPPPALAQDVAELVTRSQQFTITTTDDYHAAAGALLGIKALRKKIADTFDPHIARAFGAHRALCAEKRSADALANEAEQRIKTLMVAYDERCRARDEAARRVADTIDAEARAASLRAAEDADAAGDVAAGDLYRHAAAANPATLVAPSTPKAEGIGLRETWTARVVDLAALVRAAATTPQYVALLKPDMPALHAQARSLRALLRIPGVEAVCSRSVSARIGSPGGSRGPQDGDRP